jgi:tetratricopeptide (TPR) repeat protein
MLRRPENSRPQRRILPVLASLAAATLVAPATAQQPSADGTARHDRCVALAQANPKEAIERAKLWHQEGGGFAADHCIAMALYELRDYRGAAERFEELAAAMMALPKAERAQALDQAGQSWLAADEATRALADFDAALKLGGEDADLLIDRAEARAMAKQYWEAIDDLNRALELAPQRADAYIYRGSAYRSVDALELALDDVERGLALNPHAVLGFLERGNIRRLKGDLSGAREDWRRVAESAPNTPAAIAAKVNLERLDRESEAGGAAAAKSKSP